MRYNTLMKKVEEGTVEILAWELNGNAVSVIQYPANNTYGRGTRKVIDITNIPEEGITG